MPMNNGAGSLCKNKGYSLKIGVGRVNLSKLTTIEKGCRKAIFNAFDGNCKPQLSETF